MSRFWWILLTVTLVGSVVVELVWPYYDEPHALWEYAGFYAVLGFVGCAVIVYVSKWIGKFWLQRPVQYYEKHAAPEPVRPEGGEGGEDA